MTEQKQPVQQPMVEELSLEDLQHVGRGVVPGDGGTPAEASLSKIDWAAVQKLAMLP